MTKLTKKFVETLSCSDNKEAFYWDSEIKGLGVKIYSSGRKSYILQYRNQFGKTRRITIGYHGKISVDQARELAKKNLGHLSFGEDPGDKKKAALQAQSARKTISHLVDEFFTIHAVQPNLSKKAISDYKIWANLYILPKFGSMFIDQLTDKELLSWKQSFKDKTTTFNRILTLMSSMFSLALKLEWCNVNPVKNIDRFKENKRYRWLQDEDLDRLWYTLEQYNGYPPANAIKMLILTGSRKGEVLNATWDQFDFNRGVWIKPSHLTKQKKTEHVPLSEEALEFLLEIKEHSQSQYLFPGRKEKEPLADIKRFWSKLLKEANIEDLHIHDLRHTYASHLVTSGLSLSVVGRLLGHSNPNTTQRYAHLADQVLRDATNLFAGKLKKNKKKEPSE